MTGPNEEFDYTHLEQEIHVTDKYSIQFNFYDHAMCGSCLYHVYLLDKESDKKVTLRIDNPCSDGRPTLLDREVLAILRLAQNHPKNSLTLLQMICCLGQSHYFSKKLSQKIEETFGLDLRNTYDKIWENPTEFEPKTKFKPFEADLNELYPLPTIHENDYKYEPTPIKKVRLPIEEIDGILCVDHPIFGIIFVDEECQQIGSFRSLSDTKRIHSEPHLRWSKKESLCFKKFYEAIKN